MTHVDPKLVDAALDNEGQKSVAKLIKDLPEDTVSLAWRSQLNEKLLKCAVAKKRPVPIWLWGSLGSAAVAGCLGVVLTLQFIATPQTSNVSGIESSIVSAHRNSVALAEVSGSGLNFDEVTAPNDEAKPAINSPSIPWTRDDAEDL